MKQQKLKLVRKIVKGQDESRPWGVEVQAKVPLYPIMYYRFLLSNYCLNKPFVLY